MCFSRGRGGVFRYFTIDHFHTPSAAEDDSKSAPRGLQMAPYGSLKLQHGRHGAQRNPKTDPRCGRYGFSTRCETVIFSNISPRPIFTRLPRLKTIPRAPQEASRWPHAAPRNLNMAPIGPDEPPRRPQDAAGMVSRSDPKLCHVSGTSTPAEKAQGFFSGTCQTLPNAAGKPQQGTRMAPSGPRHDPRGPEKTQQRFQDDTKTTSKRATNSVDSERDLASQKQSPAECA